MQGDCLHLLPLLADASVDLILTDPPYGIRYESRSKKLSKRTVAGDQHPFIWWLHDGFRALKDGGSLLCFCRWDVLQDWKSAIEFADFTVRSCIVWDKGIHGMGNTKAAFAPRHELILFATKGDFAFQSGRLPDIMLSRKVPSCDMRHPTQKPVPLLKRLIEATTLPGATVLDPFCGSGSTAVACVETGRNYIVMELEQEYCQLTRERVTEAKKE